MLGCAEHMEHKESCVGISIASSVFLGFILVPGSMRQISIKWLLICISLSLFGYSRAELKLGFYDTSCPKAEKIIFDYVKEHISNAPSLAAALLRMHFHDCFVRGCDASVLINSTSTNKAEKSSFPDLSLRGFDFYDKIKSLIEAECPGVVSCADIIALVARDAVVTIGGPMKRHPSSNCDDYVSRQDSKNLSTRITSVVSLEYWKADLWSSQFVDYNNPFILYFAVLVSFKELD